LSEIRIPDLFTLRRIKVLSRLSETQLIAIANQLRVHTAARREVLLEAGSTEKTSLYIIKGKVSLSAADGKKRTIEVEENQELRPVARLRPSIYDVTALGPVSYLKVDVDKLAELADLPDSSLGEISVHSMFSDYDDEDSSIVNHLYHNLMDNSIKLPSLPSVAERIQQIYQGRDTDIEAMVHILVTYPDITRKIKNVARCPRDSDLSATGKIRYSIKRLGIRSVYCLIMTYAIGKLVRRMPVAHLNRVSSFWDHSLTVAAIARILAKKNRKFSPDVAMLAGLVHGIGVLVIDQRLLDSRHLMLDHLEIDHAIQLMRPEISSLLLRKWNFADELITVAEECGDWSRNPHPEADLCDLVLAANYYGMMQGDVNHSLPRVAAIPAMEKLGITPQDSIDAIREAGAVRRNIKKLFI
jgi:HD-like signal output (HDOD) protein